MTMPLGPLKPSRLAGIARQVAAGHTEPAGIARPAAAPQGPPGLAARGNRPISTVISSTEYDVRNGEAQVKYAGHVQFQPSENDLRNHPELAHALGHGPVTDRRMRETLPVRGQLSNGLPFAVTSVRAQPKNAGDDKPLDPARASHVIDHGDLTDEQAQRYLAAQDKPVLPHYETSGQERANCVAGHVELTRRVLGQEIGPMPPHAMPQELAPVMAQVKTRPPSE
jgi:hypothetical protein